MQYKFEMFHAINNSHTSALRIKQFKPLMNYTYRENLYNLQLPTYRWFIVRVLITLISSSWSLNSTKTLNFDDEDRNSRYKEERVCYVSPCTARFKILGESYQFAINFVVWPELHISDWKARQT